MRPTARRLLGVLSLFGFAQFAFAQNTPVYGPAVSFSRQGAEVCATYTIDVSHPVYRERIYVFDAGVRRPIQGLPLGTSKVVAGERVMLLESSFKACARARTSAAPLSWIDQSCSPAQGICLPPRGFEIDATGRTRALPLQAAAALFTQGFSSAPPVLADQGWTFKLDIKR